MEKQKYECWVYRITSPSSKIYIGQTKDFNRRYAAYQKLKCQSQRRLFNSLLKYGFESHTIDILFFGSCTDDEILNLEEEFIALYDSTGTNGLNVLARGGVKPLSVRKGVEVSEATRAKLSEAHKGKKHTPFAKMKMSINNAMHSPENVAKMKAAMVPAINTLECLSKRSASLRKLYAANGHHLSKRVHKLTLEGEFIKEYPSTMEASRQEETTDTRISDCCNGKRKTHRGFKWVYA